MSEIEQHSPEETDRLLFNALRSRGIASVWATTPSPREALIAECRQLGGDPQFLANLASYLSANPVIAQSIETVIAQLAFSAGVCWQQAQPILQPMAHRGWHLARWLPTFLLVDGPLGRLLRQASSPLVEKLRSQSTAFPMLANSRDAFNNDLFRKVRNGFAHWSFVWKLVDGSVQIQVFHHESGAMEAQLSLLEAEALHYLSASVIQTLDEELFRKVGAHGG